MKITWILTAAALLLPTTSFAFVGLGNGGSLSRVIVKTEQFKGVSNILENSLNRPLSNEERNQLATQMASDVSHGTFPWEEDDLIIKVSDGGPRDKNSALYCIGFTMSGIAEVSHAKCASWQSGRAYDLVTIGGGINLQGLLSVFRLSISFNSADYNSTFDPIPGNYGLVTQGLTVGIGGTKFDGDSGNKTVSGGAFNVGGGFNFGTISALIIQ
ncbi:MAG: hypothetical protein ACXVA9_14285 [Bdellovibrionales bacterium]